MINIYLWYGSLYSTEHGSQPSLTTRDRELVSVLEGRIKPGDLKPRSLTPQSVTTNYTTSWVYHTFHETIIILVKTHKVSGEFNFKHYCG